MMRRVLMLALVAIGGLGAAAGFAQTNDRGVTTSGTGFSGLANVVISNGTISSNSAQTSVLRVFRDASPSVCNAKSFPGTVGGGPFAYTVIPYTNSGSSRCVTFTLSASCTNGNLAGVFLVGYSGAINAADLSQNYIGDSGSIRNNISARAMGANPPSRNKFRHPSDGNTSAPTIPASVPPSGMHTIVIVTASARRREGTYSEASAVAFGTAPPNPTAARNRNVPSSVSASACDMAAVNRPKVVTQPMSATRRP